MSQALAVLSAKDLCVGYGKKTVLENVRLEFLKGEFILEPELRMAYLILFWLA